MTVSSLVLLAALGLVIGSFLNVCIARIPAGESVVSPGSRCPSCRTPIAWYDNVPVLSYVLLGGRCRRCHEPISARYPLVEAITAVAFLVQGLWFPTDPVLLSSHLVLTAILIVLFGTDLDTQRLPNVITYPGVVVGLTFSALGPLGLGSAVAGALLGAAILLAIRWMWFRATGVDGMGLGDVKMLAMIGAFLGWQQVIVVLFLSTLTGAAFGIALAALKMRALSARMPFGTFLAVAAYLASLIGPELVRWYTGLFVLP